MNIMQQFGITLEQVFFVYSIIVTAFVVYLLIMLDKNKKEFIAYRELFDKKVDGTLVIDHSDPDGSYMFLEMNEGIGIVERKKHVYLEVDNSGLTRE